MDLNAINAEIRNFSKNSVKINIIVIIKIITTYQRDAMLLYGIYTESVLKCIYPYCQGHKLSQVKSQVTSHKSQVTSQVKSSQVKSSQVTSHKLYRECVKMHLPLLSRSQTKSSQVTSHKSSQVKSSQVKSSHKSQVIQRVC